MINDPHICLSKEEMDLLLEGKISRHDLEKKADVCLFCSDALEGLSLIRKSKRDSFLTSEQPFTNIKKRFYLTVFKITAAILIGGLFINIIFNTNSTSISNEELIASYTPKESQVEKYSVRGADNDYQNEILILFDKKEYKTCIQKIEALEKGKFNSYYRMLRGMSYYELDQLGEARMQFDIIIDSSKMFREKAEYYNILIRLKANQIDSAKELIRDVLNDKDHDYYQETKEILSKI